MPRAQVIKDGCAWPWAGGTGQNIPIGACLATATLTKRQKQLLDYLNGYIGQFGYAPTLAGDRESYFGLSSLATIHKHLKNLEAKGVHQAQVEPQPGAADGGQHRSRRRRATLPMLGYVAAGTPIESSARQRIDYRARTSSSRRQNTFCLRVRGESMIEEGIRDGDYIIVEGRETANDGETVVALVNGEATVKKFYREHDGRIRLEPANVDHAADLRLGGRPAGARRGGRPDAPLPLSAPYLRSSRWRKLGRATAIDETLILPRLQPK